MSTMFVGDIGSDLVTFISGLIFSAVQLVAEGKIFSVDYLFSQYKWTSSSLLELYRFTVTENTDIPEMWTAIDTMNSIHPDNIGMFMDLLQLCYKLVLDRSSSSYRWLQQLDRDIYELGYLVVPSIGATCSDIGVYLCNICSNIGLIVSDTVVSVLGAWPGCPAPCPSDISAPQDGCTYIFGLYNSLVESVFVGAWRHLIIVTYIFLIMKHYIIPWIRALTGIYAINIIISFLVLSCVL